MKDVFLIYGYGIPKDITKDENYKFYLCMVFNKIYDLVVNNNISKPILIFSGGNSDCYKPYKRTEAEEMIRWFKHFTNRECLKDRVLDWKLISEKKSLSTLENFVFCKDVLRKKKINKANINVFCEQTREKRVKKLNKMLFGNDYKVKIIPIDFDISSNRYLPVEFIDKKMKLLLKYDKWALADKKNFKKYSQAMKEKIEILRKAGTKDHPKAVRDWWKAKMKEVNFK